MPEKPEGDEGQKADDRGEAEEKRVDKDWKDEAKQEKERLAGEGAAEEPSESAAGEALPRALPEPSFDVIVTNLAVQALIAMGEVPNPITRRPQRDLDHAKHAIDLLGVLERKTSGNLTEDEQRNLQNTLFDLRTRYLSAAQL